MRTSQLPRVAASLLALAPLLVALPARASNVMEMGDGGSEQTARGGAWVARASDPLATWFNPAGLAGQATSVTVQGNLLFDDTCFSRVRAAGDTTSDPLVRADGTYPRVCNEAQLNVSPQIAATIRLTDRIGLGLALIAPNAGATKEFSDFVDDGNGQREASPARYLLARQSSLLVFPTVGLGIEVAPGLRVGASVAWGIARLKLASATMALNADGTTPANDIRANVQAQDYFVPSASVGTIWSATPELDIAATYRLTDAIRARGDVGTAANFYTRANASGDDRGVRYGDTIFEDCGTGLATTACGGGDNARVKIAIPMEAKLGVRYHRPRSATCPAGLRGPDGACRTMRDPMATDVFDVEANLTWANNSAMDAVQVRFPQDGTGRGILPVAGVAGGEIPPSADQRRGYSDVVGVRVGGDYVALPDRLALRAGAFFETSAANARYQSLDFAASARIGFAVGVAYRIHLGPRGETVDHAVTDAPIAVRRPALELMLGFGHVFVADQERRDPNASGSPAIAGTSCNGTSPVSPTTCEGGAERYRSKWPVNLGTIASSVNVINVGLAYRF